MIIEPIYFLYGAIFLATLLLVEGLYLLYQDSRGGRDAVNRRMMMLASGKDAQAVFETLRRKPLHGVDRVRSLADAFSWLDRLIAQSGWTISTRRMFLLMLGLTFATFMAFMYLVSGGALPTTPGMIVLSVLVSLAVGIFVPIVFLITLRNKRLAKFGEQLPDALDIIVRCLQAGHPVSAALGLVGREMEDPIGTEFGIAVDEIAYGLEIREALDNMARRIDLQDFQYLVVTINIQYDTGGNLAEVLANLSSVIRERFRMFQKIRGLSSEARLSAVILSFLPFMVGAMVFIGRPDYYLDVADDPMFLPAFGGILGLLLIGIFIMYRMVNFRV
jgi:tight adherence protein B